LPLLMTELQTFLTFETFRTPFHTSLILFLMLSRACTTDSSADQKAKGFKSGEL
ncbi:Hypothetical protein FKW44_024572, partial [Caligus rogercresseyi]